MTDTDTTRDLWDDEICALVDAAFETVSRNPSDHETAVAYRRAIAAALTKPAVPDVRDARCALGVGCDEAGVCYAQAHNQPEQCGKLTFAQEIDVRMRAYSASAKGGIDETRQAIALADLIGRNEKAMLAALNQSPTCCKAERERCANVRPSVPDDFHRYEAGYQRGWRAGVNAYCDAIRGADQ